MGGTTLNLLIAIGHNIAQASLVAIDPQPEAQPVQFVQVSYGLSSVPHFQGGFCIWRWPVLESEDQYLSVLTQGGLHNADYSDVTIYTLNQRMVMARYNARVALPTPGEDVRWDAFSPKGIVFHFTRLVATDQAAQAAIIEGADTLAATGTVAVAGTASITEGADTLVATGTVA